MLNEIGGLFDEATVRVGAIPLTSTPRRLSFDNLLFVMLDREDRLTAPSVALVVQVVSPDDRSILHRVDTFTYENGRVRAALVR